MYLVDTNILIWIIRGKKEYIDWFDDLEGNVTLFISSITIAEIFKNVFPQELVRTEKILSQFQVLSVTASLAKQGGLYWQQYNKKYKNLHILDCLIAATTKEHNLTLVTLNTRHFPMSDIRILDPL